MESYACNHPESTYAKRGLWRKRTRAYRGGRGGGGGVLFKAYVRFPISGMKMLILSFVQKHHTPTPPPPPPPSPWRLTWTLTLSRVLNTLKFGPRSLTSVRDAMPVYLERLAKNP